MSTARLVGAIVALALAATAVGLVAPAGASASSTQTKVKGKFRIVGQVVEGVPTYRFKAFTKDAGLTLENANAVLSGPAPDGSLGYEITADFVFGHTSFVQFLVFRGKANTEFSLDDPLWTVLTPQRVTLRLTGRIVPTATGEFKVRLTAVAAVATVNAQTADDAEALDDV
jgi:hypothetical protein